MFVYPFAIDLAHLIVPEFATSTQYATLSRYPDAAAAIDSLIDAFDLTPLAKEKLVGPDALGEVVVNTQASSD
jgi:hypothetical protein